MEITKELLICALKSNLEDIKITSYWNSIGLCTAYNLKDINLYGDTIPIIVTTEGKYFWQKKTEITHKEIYKIDFNTGSVELTEEEYNDIKNCYNKYKQEKNFKEIKKLCKNK